MSGGDGGSWGWTAAERFPADVDAAFLSPSLRGLAPGVGTWQPSLRAVEAPRSALVEEPSLWPSLGGAAAGLLSVLAFRAKRRNAARASRGIARQARKTKIVTHDEEARRGLLRGIDVLADAVAVTLGPRGRNVLLDKGEYANPQIVNDGVTIAREIDLEDPVENAGAQVLRQAASKTNDGAGDGTTTSTVLARAMVKNGVRLVVGGANPVLMKTGIEKATRFALSRLESISIPVSDKDAEHIQQVATISAGGDKEVGRMIADALLKVGGSGVISLEEGQSIDTYVELTEGMAIDKGYLSPYLCYDPDRPESGQWEASNALVLVTDQKISQAQQELFPLLAVANEAGRPLLIIAENVEKEALATLVLNKMRGVVDCCAIGAPAFGENRKALLQDIALVTGATLISEEMGGSLAKVEASDFGTARKVTVKKDRTTISADAPKHLLEQRCEQLRRQIEEESADYTRDQLRKRLAKLSGGVAVVKVGAATEAEMKDRKLRLEDAISATMAAVAEGIVPGGGAALCHLSKELRSWASEALSGDELLGAQIVADAMVAPAHRIADNAGRNGALIVERILAEQDHQLGYDAFAHEFVNMNERGIIDPTKVVRSALQNASSVAAMILTTDCVVVDNPANQDPPMPAGGMGGF